MCFVFFLEACRKVPGETVRLRFDSFQGDCGSRRRGGFRRLIGGCNFCPRLYSAYEGKGLLGVGSGEQFCGSLYKNVAHSLLVGPFFICGNLDFGSVYMARPKHAMHPTSRVSWFSMPLPC